MELLSNDDFVLQHPFTELANFHHLGDNVL
jgi:hypothetical protein